METMARDGGNVARAGAAACAGAVINVHHLELFYYVARHGGISAAVRHIPYGIQQPAVSGQVRALEADLGVQLFERSPFRLTPAGARLFAHVQPFFAGLEAVAAELRQSQRAEVRVAGAELVLRDHLPRVWQRVKAKFPALHFSLRITGFRAEVEGWIREQEIDLALVPLAKRPAGRLHQVPLAQFPLVLLAHRRSPIKSAAELWARRRITEPLIGLAADTTLARNFQAGLRKQRVSWPQTSEATSLDLVARYVANGDGFGVSILTDPRARPRDVRVLPLEGFAPLVMGALWGGELSTPARVLVDELRSYARETWPERAAN